MANLAHYTAAELKTLAAVITDHEAGKPSAGAAIAACKNAVGQRLAAAQQATFLGAGLSAPAITTDGA